MIVVAGVPMCIMLRRRLPEMRRDLPARRQPLNTHTKSDQSPVTAADHASEALILQVFLASFPASQSYRKRQPPSRRS